MCPSFVDEFSSWCLSMSVVIVEAANIVDVVSDLLTFIFVERLSRSLRYEEVYLKAYESVAEARHGIVAYFEFYNYQRLHQALGYRAPRQVFVQALDLSSSARGKSAGARPTLSAQ